MRNRCKHNPCCGDQRDCTRIFGEPKVEMDAVNESIRRLDQHISASAHYSGYVNGISRSELIFWRKALADK